MNAKDRIGWQDAAAILSYSADSTARALRALTAADAEAHNIAACRRGAARRRTARHRARRKRDQRSRASGRLGARRGDEAARARRSLRQLSAAAVGALWTSMHCVGIVAASHTG